MADQPNLGYGKQSEATIDQANIAMRAMPWYQEQMQAWGQDPGHPTLSKSQSQQILKLAQANGYIVDEGNMEVDDHGNFNPIGHKLRNTLIVAGIAAATIATMGAAGAFSGAAAGGASAAGTSSAAGLAGVEGGAAGLSSGALAGLGTGAMGAVPVGGTLAGVGTAAGLAGVEGLPAGLGDSALAALGPGAEATGAAAAAPGVFDAAGNFIGDTTVTGIGSGAEATGGLGSTLGKLGTIAGGVGKAIGAADTAAGNNALDQEHAGLTANAQNITGQSAFEQELMARAREDDTQRGQARKDAYRASYAANPRVSPFDPVGAPKYSPGYTSTLEALGQQAQGKLATASPYDTNGMAPLAPYKPIDPADVQGATNTAPGTLRKVGQVLGPAMSTAQLIASLWK